jgi:hypothetical protein
MFNALGRIVASVTVIVVSILIVEQIQKHQLVDKAVDKLSK